MTIKKNIEISVESSTRKVFFEDNFLGLTGENLQGYVVFSFKDKFVSGVPRVEIVQGSNKYIITDMETDTENETYKLLIKSSLLTTSNVQMQLVITESAEQDSIPIFKSKMFSLYVAESINAETTIPEEYAAWIDTANAKIAEINEKLEDVDTALGNVDTAIQNAETATTGAENVNISSSKSGKTTTVVTTNRNGEETSNEVLDGNDGEDGIGLQFMWQGTRLGIKRENDSEYVFVDLQGQVGPIGPQGNPFQIKKTYATIELMVADYDNMAINDYVMISGSVEDEDNATLWVKTEQEDPTYKWQYLADFSGASGVVGPVGATPNIQIGTVTSGDTPSVTRTGTNEEPILNFVLQPGPKGNTGDKGDTGNGIASIAKTSTSGLVDTYTITYTNGSTTTFNVNNGKGIVSITKVSSQDNIDTYRITYNDGTTFDYEIENGSVTQTQFDDLEDRVHDLERNQKTGEATGTEIDLTDAFDTRPRYLGIDASETTQNTVLLPSEYTQVDYIQSSGRQYIDTGFKPNNNTKYDITLSVNNLFADAQFFISSQPNNRSNIYVSANGYISAGYGTAFYNTSTQAQTQTKYNLILDKNLFYINNELSHTFATGTFTNNVNTYLFAQNFNGSAQSFSIINLYACKIYDNDVLVRDFKPCYRNSDNEVGLYDLVNGVFYTNAGTNSFTYGSAYNTPTPSPEYPQDVETMVGYRNLWNDNRFSNATTNGMTLSHNSKGEILLNGTATAQTDFNAYYFDIPSEMKQIILSGGSSSASIAFQTFTSDGTYIGAIRDTGSNGTYTIPSNAAKYALNIRIPSGTVLNNYVVHAQLLLGTEEKPYVPYGSNYIALKTTNGTDTLSYPISLANQELLNKGDYVDKIIVDEKTGQSYIEKVWGKIILDGSEKWQLPNITDDYLYFQTNSYDNVINGNINLAFVNYFSKLTSYLAQENGWLIISIDRHLRFRIDKTILNDVSSISKAINSFKLWLNSHNTIVYCLLAEPQLIPIDNPNIKLLNGVNHITNSEGAEMDIVYVKDINIYLDSINARLEALENANQGE